MLNQYVINFIIYFIHLLIFYYVLHQLINLLLLHYNLTYVNHLIYNPFFIIYDYLYVLLLIRFISILSIIRIMDQFIMNIHVLMVFLILIIIEFINQDNFNLVFLMFLIIF